MRAGERDYTRVIGEARRLTGDRDARMRGVVRALWGAFGAAGYSWVGFYVKDPGAEEMVLACREPKPACSPIGLHGMCGRSWREQRALVVRDVRTLGANYIACDPKDLSEIVVPMIGVDGACAGVLDADSHEVGAFGETDARGLGEVLVAAGLTQGSAPVVVV